MAVSRCVCHDVPFSRLIELARRDGVGFEHACEQTGAGTGCGTCRPYARLAVLTGEADLPVMSPAQLDAMIRRHL